MQMAVGTPTMCAYDFLLQSQTTQPNNAINADSEKRRAFVAPYFTAGYGERSADGHRKS
jgi:hypothetical protein